MDELDTENEISKEDFVSFVDRHFPEISDEFSGLLFGSCLSDPKVEQKIDGISKHYTLCIHPSRYCNLSCRYCFGSEDYLPGEISLETAKTAIDFLVLKYGADGESYAVDLSGSGEPLLKFDFIKEIDKHCETLRKRTGKNIIISFATNATLVTDEIAEYLKKSKYILYGVSIDGNKTQNSLRVYKDKTPAYDDTVKNIEKLNNGHLGLAVTITHNNEAVDIIYSHLHSLNVDAVSMHLIRDFGDSETSLNRIDIDNLMYHYNKLAELLIQNIEKGNYEYIMPLIRGDDIFGDYIKEAFYRGAIAKYRCDAGRSRISVDEEGFLYTCSVLNGNKDLRLGSIYQGIDPANKNRLNISNIEISICKDCWCRNICGGECMANAYLDNKTIYNPIERLCKIRKQLISLAVSFAEYLRINHKEAYAKIRDYAIN